MTVDVPSVRSTTVALSGPDVGDPAGQRAAAGDDDVADRDAVVRALVERDDPPELRRLARR